MVYYVNPGSVYAIGILFPILCTIGVILRFLARRRVKLSYGPDDWAAVCALVFITGCGIVLIIGDALHAIGWHSPTQRAEHSLTQQKKRLFINFKLQFAFFPLMALAMGFIRLTLVLFYRRIFLGRVINGIIWTMTVLIVGWMIAFFFAALFHCGSDFTGSWEKQEYLQEYCGSRFEINAAMSASDVVLDILILVIPIKPVWNLHMSTGRKFLVLIMFMGGILSIAAGIARMVFLKEVLTYDFGSSDNGTSDTIGIGGTALWWSYLEMGIGGSVSNLPPIVGVVKEAFTRFVWIPLASVMDLRSLRRDRSKSNASSVVGFPIVKTVNVVQTAYSATYSLSHDTVC